MLHEKVTQKCAATPGGGGGLSKGLQFMLACPNPVVSFCKVRNILTAQFCMTAWHETVPSKGIVSQDGYIFLKDYKIKTALFVFALMVKKFFLIGYCCDISF